MTAATIWVTFQLPGIHCYPDAPDAVAYLRSPHRHLFHFKVSVEVTHDNRDIEFHLLLNTLRGLYADGTLQLDHKSCETIARELLARVVNMYPNRAIAVAVSEDGECGAEITYTGDAL